MTKIREILLTQYIGAILIALLVLQAAIEIVTRVVRIGYWLFTYSHTHSVLESRSESFHWSSTVVSVVTAVLYLLAAYALARWLYLPAVSATRTEVEKPATPDMPDEPQQ